MVLSNTTGWQTIRNDNNWDYGDVHLMLYNGQLYFGLKGNYPSEHWFSNEFQVTTLYHVVVHYSTASKSVSLTVNGTLLETRRYWRSRCVCVTPGYVGCWRADGNFKDQLRGSVSNVEFLAQGVHQMRSSPADRAPASVDNTVIKPPDFHSEDGCTYHRYTVHAEDLRISFQMKMTQIQGWQTVRADNDWAYGNVMIKLFDGRLYFAIKGNYPSEHWFSDDFRANTSYTIGLIYRSRRKSLSLSINGKLRETKTYWASRCVCVTSGYFGCMKAGSSFKDKFVGSISDFKFDPSGVHQMRNSPNHRRPATFLDDGDVVESSHFMWVTAGVSSLVCCCCISVLVWNRRRLAGSVSKSQDISFLAEEAPPESPVVGRPVGNFSGPAVTGRCFEAGPKEKEDQKPYVPGFPVATRAAQVVPAWAGANEDAQVLERDMQLQEVE